MYTIKIDKVILVKRFSLINIVISPIGIILLLADIKACAVTATRNTYNINIIMLAFVEDSQEFIILCIHE